MKKIKIFSIVLCVFLALHLFTGCRSPEIEVTSDTLQIAVEARGYGSDWVKTMCRYFKQDTGIDAKVVWEGISNTFAHTTVRSGPKINKIDLFVVLENTVFNELSQNNYVQGYKHCWADLTDVYESPIEGYDELEENPDLKIKDIVDPYFYDAATYTDGKQYMMSYSTSVTGLLYNLKAWNDTNANLPEDQQLTLPRTTDEMFELFDRISALPEATRGGAVPFNFNFKSDYTIIFILPLWAQYLGREAAYDVLKGKWNGSYASGYEMFNDMGREYVFEVVEKIVKTNKYYDNKSANANFTKTQIDFLKGRAFFSFNGDWLERETTASPDSTFKPGDVEVSFLKLPVLSKVVLNSAIADDFPGGNTTANDEKLRAIIDYIDNNPESEDTEEKADELDIELTTLQFLRGSRGFTYQDEGARRVMVVPAYSRNLDKAKRFLKYIYSKKGQEIMMSEAVAMMCPIKVDLNQFDYYTSPSCTEMTKSKLDIFQTTNNKIGESRSTPIQYLGQIRFLRLDSTGMPATVFHNKSPSVVRALEYDYYKAEWANMIKKAGVKD